jgi:hypothetical protein
VKIPDLFLAPVAPAANLKKGETHMTTATATVLPTSDHVAAFELSLAPGDTAAAIVLTGSGCPSVGVLFHTCGHAEFRTEDAHAALQLISNQAIHRAPAHYSSDCPICVRQHTVEGHKCGCADHVELRTLAQRQEALRARLTAQAEELKRAEAAARRSNGGSP